VLPSVAPGGDPLLRETIVYLTCLHESGHAFGLAHTHNFADIMYSFQYGGDIKAYFGRYRVQLKDRADIPMHSGISPADRVALRLAIKQDR
jgi:predicted Zn-dependent protease